MATKSEILIVVFHKVENYALFSAIGTLTRERVKVFERKWSTKRVLNIVVCLPSNGLQLSIRWYQIFLGGNKGVEPINFGRFSAFITPFPAHKINSSDLENEHVLLIADPGMDTV